MGPLRIFGTTSRLDCSRQLRRCVAQLGPTVGVVKPGGEMNTWKRLLLPSGKLSRPEKTGIGTRASYNAAKRNARHAVHHARQKADKKVYKNIDPKSS